MIQRILTAIILFSMVLHCAGRIGFLSYLYQNRNEWAHAAGLIQEVPIALCSSEYDFNESLNIPHADAQPATPAGFLTAQEIILFFTPSFSIDLRQNLFADMGLSAFYVETVYSQPLRTIFQPPKVS